MGNIKSICSKNDNQSKKCLNSDSYFCRTFSDFYEIKDECLGRGMSGKIMTVICKTTQKKYALKTLDFNIVGKKNAESEAYVSAMGEGQKNIVQLKDVFIEDSHICLVMEKLEGGNLLEYLETHECLDELVASQIIKEIATALKFLHDHGIAHRDVKLGNIFFVHREFFNVKLGDFGLANGIHRKPCCGNHGWDKFSDCSGTLDYFSPELAKIALGFNLHYTKQCDMWSLGVCLYIMLTGRMLFAPKNWMKCGCGLALCDSCHRSILCSIENADFDVKKFPIMSEHAKDLILKLLTKDPEKRYTADQVLRHPFIASNCF